MQQPGGIRIQQAVDTSWPVGLLQSLNGSKWIQLGVALILQIANDADFTAAGLLRIESRLAHSLGYPRTGGRDGDKLPGGEPSACEEGGTVTGYLGGEPSVCVGRSANEAGCTSMPAHDHELLVSI